MLYFRIGFENGDSLETGFNGTLEEAKAYYLGRVFNLGAVDDDMQRCNSVEQLPTLEMGLAAWIASGGLVVITDGTVSPSSRFRPGGWAGLSPGGGWLEESRLPAHGGCLPPGGLEGRA